MNVDEGLFASAGEIMSSPVVTVTPDTTVQQAVALLEADRISGLPVVDQDNKLLGILTEFDLLCAISDHRLHGHVHEFMSTDVVTVEESTTLTDVTNLMVKGRMRRVPVLRDGRVVGIVSRRDLVFVGSVRQQLLNELPALPAVTLG